MEDVVPDRPPPAPFEMMARLRDAVGTQGRQRTESIARRALGVGGIQALLAQSLLAHGQVKRELFVNPGVQLPGR